MSQASRLRRGAKSLILRQPLISLTQHVTERVGCTLQMNPPIQYEGRKAAEMGICNDKTSDSVDLHNGFLPYRKKEYMPDCRK